MPTPSDAHRSQLLEAHGSQPLHQREHYADWLSSSLAHALSQAPGEQGLGESHSSATGLRVATPFYSLAQDAPVYNDKVAEFKAIAHRLVESGLTTKEDLEAVSLRLTSVSEAHQTKGLFNSIAETIHSLSPAAQNEVTRAEMKAGGATTDFSFQVQGIVSVDEREAVQFDRVPGMSKMESVFLHELGHAMRDPTKLDMQFEMAEMAKGGSRFDGEGGREVQRMVVQAVLTPPEDGLQGSRGDWRSTVAESFADAYAVTAAYVLHGKEVALDMADAFLELRREEYAQMLHQTAQGRAPLSEGHFTYETVLSLKESILNGEMEAAVRAGDARAVAMQATIEGVTREYEGVRTAEVNPYHLSESGLERGLPDSLAPEDFLRMLVADSQGSQVPGLVVMPEHQWAEIQRDGGSLQFLGNDGKLQDAKEFRSDSMPGHVALVVGSNDVLLTRGEGEEAQAFVLNTALQTRLEQLQERDPLFDAAMSKQSMEHSTKELGATASLSTRDRKTGDAGAESSSRESSGSDRGQAEGQGQAQAEMSL